MSALADTLRKQPHCLPTTVMSIDDFYLPHAAQRRLAAALPANPLVQHRGQPSTHDLPLIFSVFFDLRAGEKVKLPSYDKSAHNGQGDRSPVECWELINESGKLKTKIVIFEGWCVGFRSLARAKLQDKWNDAVRQRKDGNYSGRLGWNRLEDIEHVNECLIQYDSLTDQLDGLIHLDAADPLFVYGWRLEQETQLRASVGKGMSDEQVNRFVDGYYPAYELYTEELRAGAVKHSEGRQLRLIIGQDRKVKEAIRL